MRNFSYFLVFGWLVSCANLTPERSSVPQPVSTPPKDIQTEKGKIQLMEETENVNVDGVRRVLALSLERENLGYIEKAFDTCDVGNGYSKVSNCRKKYFILIQLRMQCRDSEGTTSEIVTSADLTAMSNRDLVWSVKNEKGEARTDAQGYAQIQWIASASQRGQRVRLGNNTDFLYLKADEIRQIILPRYWCRS